MQRANPVTFFAMKIYKFFLAYMGWKVPKHLISKLTIPDPGSRFKNVPVYCMIDLSYISHLQHIQIPVFGTQSREK